MPKFICLEPIEHDHRRYEVDAEITLPEAAAEPLLAMGHIVAASVRGRGGKASALPADSDTAAPREG